MLHIDMLRRVSSTTPARLSLELNVNQKRIRAFLREQYGRLPEGLNRWELEDSQADAVRAQFDPQFRPTDPIVWTLEIGDTVLRRELHAAYKGQEQGGIITPKLIPDILVITSPESGARHGYDTFEGLQGDGSFLYTGEGQYGPQVFARGNTALRDAAENGRPIRLFTKQGTYVTYVGEFTTGEPAFSIKTIPDSDGNPREGIIFKLVPVDADVEALDAPSAPLAEIAQASSWAPPESSSYVVGAPLIPAERVVSRIEFELQRDFGQWIESRGETPQRLRLNSAGATIEPDLYVSESGWVVEAKKSPAREYVRTAIGQVLDYSRLARESGRPAVPVILLPSRPIAHLEALLAELGILLIVRDDQGFLIIE
ncbi:hypothetical protein CSX12_01340 [Microbacterium sp. Y-01]|uniref:hypothetical protein n=1 Tax=Microbacterium sp. Y-01 TaxID=2048898 RepID=UPI000F5D8E10|nr:hypothetical protein [Microbacterium sp. Y-01]AZH77198.1 hypothetical protein CSX12_01340 [Microbacterium sp. Y-01]